MAEDQNNNAVLAGFGPVPRRPDRDSPVATRSPVRAPAAFRICDRCGDIELDKDGGPCRCATPYDNGEVQRRHSDAVRRAQGPQASKEFAA